MTDIQKSVLTTLLSILGGMLVSKGVFSAADWSTLSSLIVGIAGTAIAAGALIWKAWQHTQANKAIAMAGSTAKPTPGVTVTIDKNTASPALVQAALDPTNAVKLGGA